MDQAEAIVSLWRQSFQRAMGLPEQNEQAEFMHQLAFYRSLDPAQITVALSKDARRIVGFVVQQAQTIEHLYVHVECQGTGVGKCLLDHAKFDSPAGIRLHTFQSNQNALGFYVSQGFVEVSRGVASLADNPWASSESELGDVEYHWPTQLY